MPMGTADEVAERIIAAADSAGANQVQLALNRGALPHDLFIAQIERFAREVLPRLQAHEVKTRARGRGGDGIAPNAARSAICQPTVKDLVVIGGPNGAGKTTAAGKLLPVDLNIREFVNADEIARGISPFNPEGSAVLAGRLMVERMRELSKAGQSFAFETCAGRSHARFLRSARDLDYRVTLVFLWLPSPEAAAERVARRVEQGGHSIPIHVITRRYFAGLRNLRQIYLPAVDIASIFDNSDGAGHLIADLSRGAI